MKTVKIITFFILTLYLVTSSLFADDMRFNSIDWNELTIHQKTQVIQDYKDFLFNLESSKSVKLSNKKYSFFNRYIKNLFNAYASEGYDCLYGGWPSNRNTEGLCKWPQENNTKYNDYKNVCSESQLLCNPMLFGDNICIDFSTLKKRKLAYSQCESKFKKEGRDLDEVVNNIKEKDFNDLTKVIDDICNDPTVGTQHVTPICTALKTKMSKYIPNTNPKGIVHGKQDSLGVKGKLDLLQNLTNSFERDLHKFATECGEDFPKAKEVECYNLLQKLKKTEQDIEFLKEELDRTMGSVAFCKAYSETMEISENFFVTTEQATEQIACTPKEKASYKASCFKDIMCFGASSLLGVAAMAVEAMGVDTGDCIKGENSCAVQAITALIDTLWATVTGVWDLLKMGYNAASDWVSDTWNTFWDDTEEVENKTSDAQMMLSNLSADQKKQIEEDKEGWLASTMKGLWSSLKHWMSHDIYCQQWSGAPRYSTCEKPFQSDCLKCDTLFKGTCALIGAVSSEIVKTYFTGGALTLVGRGAGAAMSSSKALSAAVNGAKSLIKMPITGATKAGKWIAKTSIVQRASGYVGSNLAGTGVAVTARLATLKTSAAYKLFKSAAANTYKYTGVKGYIKVNKEAFKLGSKHASNLFKPGVPNPTANTATRSGLVYNAVKSNAPPIGIPSLPAASKITNYKISKKFKTAKVFTDATEDIQRQSLKRFSDAVDVDEEIVRLMDKAHLAPKGFAKNKQIKLLIDEVSKRPGMNKVKAKNLILGEVNADGVRVGGLASEDVMVLGFRDRIKNLFSKSETTNDAAVEALKKQTKAEFDLIRKQKIDQKLKLKTLKQSKEKLKQQELLKKQQELRKVKEIETKKMKDLNTRELQKQSEIKTKQKKYYQEHEKNFKQHIREKNPSEDVKKYSSADEIEKEYRLKDNKEVEIDLSSRENARYYAQNHPLLHKYNFGTPRSGPQSGWKPFKSRLEKSSFKGKYVGFEKKMENGTYARYRLDWDPKKGAHYNVEMTVIDEMGKSKNVKFATKFDCNGAPCSEEQIKTFVDRMQLIGAK